MRGLDHAMVVGFALLLPLYARFNYPRFKRRLASGEPDARSRQYLKTIARQWALSGVALAVWWTAGRSAAGLGLARPAGAGFWLALLLALVLVLAWRRQIRAAMTDPETRAVMVERLEVVAPILPETPRELRLFTALSITAGICEELLFRGYLIAYLESFVGLAPAAFLSGALFGAGHIYQGARQTLKIAVVGWVFVLFYLGSGSLWIPMALHALLDAAQGKLAFALRGDGESEGDAVARTTGD